MAIVKASYTKSRNGAKASIRYIQHRPGKPAAREQVQHGHKNDYCCGLFEKFYREGLPLVRDDPTSYIFHSRYCDIFNPYSERYWYMRDLPVRGNAPQTDTVVSVQKASADYIDTSRKAHTTRTLFGFDGAM